MSIKVSVWDKILKVIIAGKRWLYKVHLIMKMGVR